MTSVTSVAVRQSFTCAGCGGRFLDRHSCPTTPSLTRPITSPPVVLYAVDLQNGPVVFVDGTLVTRPAW